jgi:nucleoside diphosphate kinase
MRDNRQPDGVQRGLVGEIIGRFEKRGFKLIALKLVHATPEHLQKRESNPRVADAHTVVAAHICS